MIRPNVFLPGRVFGFKTSGRVFYIKTLGWAFKNMRPDVYISSTRPGILHTLLKFGHEIIYVVSVGQGILYFYISGNARGFWSTPLQLGTDEKVELATLVSYFYF